MADTPHTPLSRRRELVAVRVPTPIVAELRALAERECESQSDIFRRALRLGLRALTHERREAHS